LRAEEQRRKSAFLHWTTLPPAGGHLSSSPLLSIHDLKPLDQGGPIARAGFSYQDHVAVGFCIEMLTDGLIVAVWCELHDDILLITRQDGEDWIEFVQVKAERRESLWSPAALCRREKPDAPGTSILERSLAQSRCGEKHRFRVVTLSDINTDLRVLTHDRGSVLRHRDADDVRTLVEKLAKQFEDVPIEGPGGLRFWVDSVLWLVAGTEDAVRNANRTRLQAFLYDRFDMAAPDQVDAVYEFLFRMVEQASRARVPPPYTPKKIGATPLQSDLQAKVSALKQPYAAAGGNPLRRALMRMGMAEMDINDALGEQAAYLAAARRQEYFALRSPQSLYEEVRSVLFGQRAAYRLDSEGDSARQRHLRCIQALDVFHASLPEGGRPPAAHLRGMMYDMVKRGLHTFEFEGVV
jgi:hypothetical protein